MAPAEVRSLPPWSSRAFLVGVVATGAVYFFLGTYTQSLLFNALGVLATIAMLIALLLNHPEPRSAWLLMVLGMAMLTGGDILYGVSQAVPSPADVLYISAYPLIALGLLGVTRSTIPGHERHTAIEVLVVTATIGALAVVFLLVPAAYPEQTGAAGIAVAVGYPILDVGLLAIAFRLYRFDERRRIPFGLVMAGLSFMLIADSGYALLDFGSDYIVGSWLDAMWLLAYGCLTASMLHRAHARTGVRAQGPVPPPPPAAMMGAYLDAAVAQMEAAERRDAMIWRVRRQGLRFRVLLTWTGSALLALAGGASVFAIRWAAPDTLMVAGVYGGTGAICLLAGRIRA